MSAGHLAGHVALFTGHVALFTGRIALFTGHIALFTGCVAGLLVWLTYYSFYFAFQCMQMRT